MPSNDSALCRSACDFLAFASFCSPPKRRPVVRSPFRLKRHLLADSIASHRIVSYSIASAPSAAAGSSAGDWPAAPDKRFVRDAGRNWSKGDGQCFDGKAENKEVSNSSWFQDDSAAGQ